MVNPEANERYSIVFALGDKCACVEGPAPTYTPGNGCQEVTETVECSGSGCGACSYGTTYSWSYDVDPLNPEECIGQWDVLVPGNCVCTCPPAPSPAPAPAPSPPSPTPTPAPGVLGCCLVYECLSFVDGNQGVQNWALVSQYPSAENCSTGSSSGCQSINGQLIDPNEAGTLYYVWSAYPCLPPSPAPAPAPAPSPAPSPAPAPSPTPLTCGGFECSYSFGCANADCCCIFERHSAASPSGSYDFGGISFFGYQINQDYPKPSTFATWDATYGVFIYDDYVSALDGFGCPGYYSCFGSGPSGWTGSGMQYVSYIYLNTIQYSQWNGSYCQFPDPSGFPYIVTQIGVASQAADCMCVPPEAPPEEGCSETYVYTNCSACDGQCEFVCENGDWVQTVYGCSDTGLCNVKYRTYSFADFNDYADNLGSIPSAAVDDPFNPWTLYHVSGPKYEIGKVDIGDVTLYYGPSYLFEAPPGPTHSVTVTLSGGPSWAAGAYSYNQTNYNGSGFGWTKMQPQAMSETYIMEATYGDNLNYGCGGGGYCVFDLYYTHREYTTSTTHVQSYYNQGVFSLSTIYQSTNNVLSAPVPWVDPMSYPDPYTYGYAYPIPNGVCGYVTTRGAYFTPDLSKTVISNLDTVTFFGIWQLDFEDDTYNQLFDYDGCCPGGSTIPQTTKYRAGSITVSITGGDHSIYLDASLCQSTKGYWEQVEGCPFPCTCPEAMTSPEDMFGDVMNLHCQGVFPPPPTPPPPTPTPPPPTPPPPSPSPSPEEEPYACVDDKYACVEDKYACVEDIPYVCVNDIPYVCVDSI